MKRPPFIPTVLTVFFVVLMTSLGFWQLDRAKQKEQMLTLMQADNKIKINNINQLKSLPRYSVVEIRGHYLDSYQFFLDNQFQEKRVGYHVFTPFYAEDLQSFILVNRGWIEKPQINSLEPLSNSQRTLKGRLVFPPKVGFQLGEIELTNQAKQVITYFEEDKIKSFLQSKLCKTKNCSVSQKVLWLDEAQADGFVRAWNPVIMPPEKHYGYAVQWFSMTFVLIVLFGYWLRKTSKLP